MPRIFSSAFHTFIHIDFTDRTKGGLRTVLPNGIKGHDFFCLWRGSDVHELNSPQLKRLIESELVPRKTHFVKSLFSLESYTTKIFIVEFPSVITFGDGKVIERFLTHFSHVRAYFAFPIIFVSAASDESSRKQGALSPADLQQQCSEGFFVYYNVNDAEYIQFSILNIADSFFKGSFLESDLRDSRFAVRTLWSILFIIVGPCFLAVIGKLTEKGFDFFFGGGQGAAGSNPNKEHIRVFSPTDHLFFWCFLVLFLLSILVALLVHLTIRIHRSYFGYRAAQEWNSYLLNRKRLMNEVMAKDSSDNLTGEAGI